MLAFLDIGKLRQRIVAPRGLVALTALCVMLSDPWAVQSAGAWLSVGAVAAVIWAGRATERQPKIVRLLAPAAAATLVTAPITAFVFGTVAPIGVLANLAAIPLAGLAVPGLMVALLLSSSWLAAGAGLCLALLDVVARTAAALPGGHFIMIAGPGAAALWLGILVVAWWLWNSPRRRWTVAARVSFTVALLSVAALFRAFSRLTDCQCLTVSFLDVGQGDAITLRSPAGRWLLIDGGPRGPQGDAGRRVVVPFLRSHGAMQLAAIVATHAHRDHFGGLPAVLDVFDPAFVLEPGQPVPDAGYLGFLGAVESDGAEWRPARRGDRLELDGVTIDVLSPDSAWAAAVAWRPSSLRAAGDRQPVRRSDQTLRGRRAQDGPRRASDVADQIVVADRAPAPYRAGLLALREGPILERAVTGLKRPPDVLLMDATGLDHPRGAGLAVHLGAVTGVPSVGVTHRPLVAVGTLPATWRGATSPAELHGRTVGRWTCTKPGARPVLAHAGWRTDADTAAALVIAVSTPAARTPVPLQEARRVAREARSLGR